jgi:recombinational DNA repair protein (RecF pathway)
MFEHRHQPLVSRRHFLNRTLQYAGFAALLLFLSLLMGMIGYHCLAGIGWIDAFYNASMILTGMGPALDIDALPRDRQDMVKIFAGVYALYSGVVFLAASGLVVSPILHRFFHRFHLDIKES